VLIIGLEAARPAMAGPVKAFVDSLGAATLSTYMAKGCVADDHPSYVGIFTGGAIEQACVREADLIVLVGLDPVELIRKPWAYQAPVVDICETTYDPHYVAPVHRLVGPLAETLPLLGEQLRESGATTSWTTDAIAEHRNRYFQGMRIPAVNGLSSSDVVQAAARAFTNQSVPAKNRPRLSVDAGAHMFSACTFWPAREPLDVLISNGLATMGFAVPAAIAAALHDPDRGAVAMTGDGGFMMCLGELKTAAATAARVCIIVFNDGCLSLIDLKRADRQLPDVGLSWQRPDFAAVASGFGLTTWRVDESAQLAPAMQAAAAHKGPSLIDVRIDANGYPLQARALRG
jgi:acetolactate synthase-1/2/3 large subunit